MSKIQNQQFYVENGMFSGGEPVTGLNGNEFLSASQDNPQWGFNAGGLYVGKVGDITAKTIDGSVLTFVSASGFIPGLFSAVSGSSTTGDVIALK